jgi:hypothetical protein
VLRAGHNGARRRTAALLGIGDHGRLECAPVLRQPYRGPFFDACTVSDHVVPDATDVPTGRLRPLGVIGEGRSDRPRGLRPLVNSASLLSECGRVERFDWECE